MPHIAQSVQYVKPSLDPSHPTAVSAALVTAANADGSVDVVSWPHGSASAALASLLVVVAVGATPPAAPQPYAQEV